jgi:hypothetical protein
MDPTLVRDLVERLTSRKFILALVVILLALVGYLTHQLDYSSFVNVALWAVGIFSGSEGLADAAGALKPHPVPTAVVTTNVDNSPAPPPEINRSMNTAASI